MTSATAGYSAISSYSRIEILRLLGERPERTVAELSGATGLHANTVREHLQRLEDDGYVIRATEVRTTRGRPRVLFSAVIGDEPVSSPVIARKVKAAAARGDLMRRVLPETGPATQGLDREAVHQVDAIIDHLEETGFAPQFDGTALSLDVTPCLHQAAQAEHRETLCSVHLAIMQGVLAEAGGPLQASSVSTEGRPNGCVVQLTRAAQ